MTKRLLLFAGLCWAATAALLFAEDLPRDPAPLQFDGKVIPLEAMTQFAVLDEPRLNVSHVENVDRLVHWLGDNGFQRLDGVKLPAWMTERIQRADAYGSVAVLPRGVSPAGIFDGPDDTKPLWLEYLRAGGRLVHVGDVPMCCIESPLVKPAVADTGMGILGLAINWGSPYSGQPALAVTSTEAALQWGVEIANNSLVGMPVENVTTAFHVFTVPVTGKLGACDWFRNVRTNMPWSGLVSMMRDYNGNNDAVLRSVWSAAHYVGKPVTVPAIPPAAPPPAPPRMRISTTAGGLDGRHEFVRGEEVKIRVAVDTALKATAVRLELLQDGECVSAISRGREERAAQRPGYRREGETGSSSVVGALCAPLISQTQPATNAAFDLKTVTFSDSAYTLRAVALQGEKAVSTNMETIGIRHLPPEHFNFEVFYGAGANLQRVDLEVADIRETGMEIHTGSRDVIGLDAAVRNHVGFSFRCQPDTGTVGDKTVTFEKNPEYFRFGPDGKPSLGTGYNAGRPYLGVSHPEIRKAVAKTMEQAVKSVADLPSFRPYVLCNDDFSFLYGWDYAPHVLAAFKADTGLDAPRKMELPPKMGAIPDDNPWVKWFEWTLINVNGAYNKAETEGALRVRPDVRTGPNPGGMMVPLISLQDANQYPPYNFGRNGFNLIASYYYNLYWQPLMTATFWMEAGRMGNRDLPEWTTPDVVYGTAGSTRGQFFHTLAGGVRGLAYFNYSERTADSWSEMYRLGKVVRRIGPVQTRLVPAKRDIGLLNSFTSGCFDFGHSLVQVYGFHNLMQAHFSVEMVSEDEIVALSHGGSGATPTVPAASGAKTGDVEVVPPDRKYKAVLLYNVKYLRQSAYDALAAYAAKGGLVILDTSIPFDIPGAKRLPVDIGMGSERTLPFPPEGAHVSTPGRQDYGRADRVELIKRAVSRYVKPQFESEDVRLVASRFEADGLPYTWFVNSQNQDEYAFCWERLIGPSPKACTLQSKREVRDWEAAEEAKGLYVSTFAMKELPGVPYDLVGGRELPVTKIAGNRFAVRVSMKRFGGALVAWLPERIASMKLAAPRLVQPGETVKASAMLCGPGGFLGLGAGKPIPGALPVEFVLKDPGGRESAVSDVRATKNGVATWEWTPAVNDPVGEWTLTASDLASGKTVERKIGVKGTVRAAPRLQKK